MTIGEFLQNCKIDSEVILLQELNPAGCYVLTANSAQSIKSLAAMLEEVVKGFPGLKIVIINRNMKIVGSRETIGRLRDALAFDDTLTSNEPTAALVP